MNIIFLTYINRSGSTYLANQFSKSDDIIVCPEAEVIMNEFLVEPMKNISWESKIRLKLQNYFLTDHKLKYWNLQIDEIDDLLKAETNFDAFFYILDAYRKKVKPEAHTIIFKAERIIHLYENIPLRFKEEYNLKLIAIIRDCRGVYTSQKNTKMPDGGKFMSRNPVKTVLSWKKFVQKSLQLNEKSDIILLKYEDLLRDIDRSFSNLLEQLALKSFNIHYSDGDLLQRIPANQKKIHKNINNKPLKEKDDKWQVELTKQEIFILERFARNELNSLGYVLKNPKICKLLVSVLIGFYYSFIIYNRVLNKIKYIIQFKIGEK